MKMDRRRAREDALESRVPREGRARPGRVQGREEEAEAGDVGALPVGSPHDFSLDEQALILRT